MIIPIVIIVLCIVSLYIMSQQEKKQGKTEKSPQVSAQEFINVRDIIDHVLYTKDNYCISFVRLQPPMSSLWSRSEKRMKTNNLVAEISKDKDSWMLLAVSRPMDITQLISQYRQLRDETDNLIRKKLLKMEMTDLQKRVVCGESVERQFYIKIWTPYKEGAEVELLERARNIIAAYESVGIVGEVSKKADIIRLCNLVHNPSYINVDEVNVDMSVPIILDMEGLQ